MRFSARIFRGIPDASLPDTHLRRAARLPCRRHRASVGLGSPDPRSWRAAVPRFARPLWPHAVRHRSEFAGIRQGRDDPRRMGGARRRPGGGAQRGDHQRVPAHRPCRGAHRPYRDPERRRRIAVAGVRRSALSGGPASSLPLPRPAARQDPRQHHQALPDHLLDPPAYDGAGASSSSRRRSSPRRARRARATSWCRAGFIRAGSTPCRRPPSSSSS
jgi:hypothetical protein